MSQQQSHDVSVAFPAGQGQGNIVLTPRGNVDLCTLLEKELSNSQVSFPGGREGGRMREGGREGGGGGERERERERERWRESESGNKHCSLHNQDPNWL